MSRTLNISSFLAATAMIGLSVIAIPAHEVSALPTPIGQPNAAMVSAVQLPTTQIDGVAWDQEIVGNTVYVGGSFQNARPAGAAAGTNLTARHNLLSYNLTTGALNTGFAPDLNNQVYAVAASPDGSRIYVGGQFTNANGAGRNRLAAYSTSTGQLITTFAPSLDYIVRSIVVTNDAVYVGGAFSTAAGQPRNGLAAFSPTNGALSTGIPTPRAGGSTRSS